MPKLLSMPQPARAEPASPAQPERNQLAAAIRVLTIAASEAEEAQRPVSRLEAVIRCRITLRLILCSPALVFGRLMPRWPGDSAGGEPIMTLVETIAELASVEDKIAAELARVGRGSVRHGELSNLLGEIGMVKARLVELRIGELNPFLVALERQRERQGRRAELLAGVIDGDGESAIIAFEGDPALEDDG